MKEVIFKVCSKGIVSTGAEKQEQEKHDEMELISFMNMLNQSVKSGNQLNAQNV